LTALTTVSLAVPKLLHDGVGIYGVCLLAMAIARYTDSEPAVTSQVGELQPQRA